MKPAIAISQTELMVVYVSIDGTWHEIPGIRGAEEGDGAADTRDVIPADGVAQKKVGFAKVPQIDIPCYALPQHFVWRELESAQRANRELQFQLVTREKVLHAPGTGNTAAIALNGDITLAGNDPAKSGGLGIGPGAMFVIGTDGYVVQEVRNPGLPTETFVTDEITTVVAAAAYSVVLPALRRGPFLAQILEPIRFKAAEGGELEHTLMLQPKVRVPEIVVVPGGQAAAGVSGAVGSSAPPPADSGASGGSGGSGGSSGGKRGSAS